VCTKRLTCAAVGVGAGAVIGLIGGRLATPQHDWVDVPVGRRVRLALQPRPAGAVVAALVMRW
jgi:hypothetical protein